MVNEDRGAALHPVVARTVHSWGQPGFGRRLKSLRVERGLSQKALAGEGMSTGYLSRLERGERPPTERAATYLADRLGVPARDFEEPAMLAAPTDLPSLLATAASTTEADVPQLTRSLREALGSDENHSPELRWQALWLLARYAGRNGEHEEELQHLRELTELSDGLPRPELRVRARTQLARCLRGSGQVQESLRYAAGAARTAAEHDLPAHERVSALLALVSAEAEAGRLPEAAAHADELLELAPQTSGTLPAEARWTCAMVRVRQGDHTTALKLLEEALAGLDSHDDLLLWLRLRMAAASMYLQINPPHTHAAAERLREAEMVIGLVGTERHKQELLSLRARLAFDEGRLDDARTLCRRLEKNNLQLSFRDRMRLDILRCRLMMIDGDTDRGVARLQALATEARDALNIDLAADIWRTLAEILGARTAPHAR
ncbi:helix-turn-helix domain-containing protein [Streptomyces sp. NBC_00859]|uniref:helix-turn-helix domain-containing protein n=1 Tax=Streptomyces sp. NBC_00859 TaxID=2903682 RepID=UPI003869B764|nr:helix-turn-helix domain-containing protein [Streptomyces sp. NBC_00859]WSZ86730.1 helix-turn-helix domain-containing protein [Streptomyces sp. NBC_00859]